MGNPTEHPLQTMRTLSYDSETQVDASPDVAEDGCTPITYPMPPPPSCANAVAPNSTPGRYGRYQLLDHRRSRAVGLRGNVHLPVFAQCPVREGLRGAGCFDSQNGWDAGPPFLTCN